MSKQPTPTPAVKDGDRCTVVAGRHAGKSGVVRDSHMSKSGHLSISVCQDDGTRFKTLAKSVVVEGGASS
jgi:ribosomal protein S4E